MKRTLLTFCALCTSCFNLLPGSDLNTLLERSPFLPDGYVDPKNRKPEETKKPEPPSSWELRGWTTLGDVTKVSMFNKAEKKSYWIDVNDPSSEVRVVGLDKASKEVSVSINGITETITLAQTKFTGSVPNSQPAPRPAPRAAPPPPPETANGELRKNQESAEPKRRVIPRRRVVVPRRTN